MLGGPVMNLVIAFFLMAVVLVGIGLPTVTTHLSGVSQCVLPVGAAASRECTPADEAAPAAAAGIEPGDTVVSYDGTEITSWDQLSLPHHGQPAPRPSRSSSSATASCWT